MAAILGFSAVATGAFGAHALKNELAARQTAEIWQTACLYHLVHAVAVLAVADAIGHDSRRGKSLRRAVIAWSLGVVCFCGSLYGLALGGPSWLGPITPLGGLAFLVGWVLVAWPHHPPKPSA